MAYRVLRAVGWVICSVLLVLLVPSSAWPASGAQLPSSVLSSPSVGSSLDSETEPVEPTDPPSTPEEPPEPSSDTASESPSLEPASPEVASLVEDSTGCTPDAPCVVQLDTNTEAWMGLTAILLVALMAALWSTTLGNSGD